MDHPKIREFRPVSILTPSLNPLGLRIKTGSLAAKVLL